MGNTQTGRIEIMGLDELIRQVEALGERAELRMLAASSDAAEVVLAKAKEKVPVGTGTLRASLRLRRGRPKKGKKELYYYITWGKDEQAYGAPVELGHDLRRGPKGDDGIRKKIGHVEERPYLRPAADESREQVVAIMEAAMIALLREVGL